MTQATRSAKRQSALCARYCVRLEARMAVFSFLFWQLQVAQQRAGSAWVAGTVCRVRVVLQTVDGRVSWPSLALPSLLQRRFYVLVLAPFLHTVESHRELSRLGGWSVKRLRLWLGYRGAKRHAVMDVDASSRCHGSSGRDTALRRDPSCGCGGIVRLTVNCPLRWLRAIRDCQQFYCSNVFS